MTLAQELLTAEDADLPEARLISRLPSTVRRPTYGSRSMVVTGRRTVV